MEESDHTVVHIPAPTGSKLGSTWGPENSLWVYSTQGKVTGNLEESELTPSMIQQLKMDADLQNSTTRRLVNETHGIFLDLQQVEHASASSKKASLVTFSRQYRSVLKACLLNLENQESSMNGHNTDYNQIKLLSFVELVWHLCEILLIESYPGGIFLHHLLEWVKWHCNTADKLASEVAGSSDIANNPKYWPAIYHLLLQGRIGEIQDLLAQHPHRNPDNRDQFSIVEELLKQMPLFKSFISYSEFAIKWNYWQHECKTRCLQGDLATYPQLLLIVQVLCGENDAFAKVKDICHDLSWYEILVAKLFYSNPKIQSCEIQYHTKFCLDLCGGKDALETWHEVLLAVIELDVHAVIKMSSECFGNWWFVAHLVDLFHHCGQLESPPTHIDYQIDLREYLLLEYASSLMSHQSLWQVAADYFSHCSTRGRHYLEAYIEQLPLENERKALKVLHLCQKFDFSTQAISIYKQMGMRAYHNNRLGSALSWSIRAKDPAFASFISERFIDEYFDKREFSSFDLIDNLGPSMLLCERLTFLGKYREFHLMYENAEFADAANLLVSLLTSNLAPKRIWLSLLTDALPLLEHEEYYHWHNINHLLLLSEVVRSLQTETPSQQVVFSSNQTYELMHCLEEFRTFYNSKEHNETSTESKVKKNKEHERMMHYETEDLQSNALFQPIRLALARNLARAFHIEN